MKNGYTSVGHGVSKAFFDGVFSNLSAVGIIQELVWCQIATTYSSKEELVCYIS